MPLNTQPALRPAPAEADAAGRNGVRHLNALAVGVAVLASLWAVACLLAYWSHAGGLWRDEVNSINVTNLPTLGDLWRNLSSESFPLLWLLWERAWSIVLGTSDAAVRAVGLATGLALIAALWLCGRWCGYVPAVALALVASNPVLLRVAASNRAYGLGFLLIVLTYHAIWRLAQEPTRRRAVVAAVVALLATQTLYYNIVFVTAMLLGALGVQWCRGDRSAVRVLAAIGGLCALSLLPYALGPIHQERAWSFVIAHRMRLTEILDAIGQALHIQSSAQPTTGGTVIATIVWLALVGVCLCALSAYSHSRSAAGWTDGGDAARFASATVLISLSAYACVLGFVGYMVEPFHLSVVVLLVAVAAGHLATVTPTPKLARAAVVGAALAMLTNLMQTFRAVEVRQTNADVVAGIVGARARPGDLVLVAPYWLGQPFARYYHGRAPWVTPPSLEQYAIGGETDVLQQMRRPVADMDHLPEIKAALRSGHAVWLVSDNDLLLSPQGASGQQLTRLLPPLPPYGAGSRPSMQPFLWRLMGREAFILHRARARQVIDLRLPGDVNPRERMGLIRISGWRGKTTS